MSLDAHFWAVRSNDTHNYCFVPRNVSFEVLLRLFYMYQLVLNAGLQTRRICIAFLF